MTELFVHFPSKHSGTSFRKDTKKKSAQEKNKEYPSNDGKFADKHLINCQSHKFSIFQLK